MKYTFLSKWTVLILTVLTAALIAVGVMLSQQAGLFGYHNVGLGVLSFFVAAIVYLLAWIIALLDSIQERRWGWLVTLIILSPILIGPLLYSLIGPRNTK
jgi:uncharacterized membrane protein